MPKNHTLFRSRVRASAGLISVTAMLLAISGCVGQPAALVASTPSPSAAAPVEGAQSIEEAWALIGCDIGGDTHGKIIEADYMVTRNGQCRPWADLNTTVAFHQVESAEAMDVLFERALGDFAPELLFVDGLVVIRANSESAVERLELVYDHRE